MVQNKDIKISVVSPVYCGELLVDVLVQRINASLSLITPYFEIILVDDGSPDNSWQKIEIAASNQQHIKGIKLTQNFGQHNAIKCGLEHCKGEWVVVMDCDLQDKPEEIEKLYSKTQQGYACVFALRDKRNDAALKRFYSWLFYSVLGVVCGIKLDARIANFGIYHHTIVEQATAIPCHSFFFPIAIRKPSATHAMVIVDHAKREIGNTTYSFSKALKLAATVLKYNSIIYSKPKKHYVGYSIEKIISSSTNPTLS